MKIHQTILYLVLGFLLLPLALVLLFIEEGLVSTVSALFFLLVSVSFIFISTKRIVTKDLLRTTWFWAIIIGGILVLLGTISFYL